jgi:hypothetical protein
MDTDNNGYTKQIKTPQHEINMGNDLSKAFPVGLTK